MWKLQTISREKNELLSLWVSSHHSVSNKSTSYLCSLCSLFHYPAHVCATKSWNIGQLWMSTLSLAFFFGQVLASESSWLPKIQQSDERPISFLPCLTIWFENVTQWETEDKESPPPPKNKTKQNLGSYLKWDWPQRSDWQLSSQRVHFLPVKLSDVQLWEVETKGPAEKDEEFIF